MDQLLIDVGSLKSGDEVREGVSMPEIPGMIPGVPSSYEGHWQTSDYTNEDPRRSIS
jgi:hypothetical protein